jgi:tetratricopeptide (TPR) repeat protein
MRNRSTSLKNFNSARLLPFSLMLLLLGACSGMPGKPVSAPTAAVPAPPSGAQAQFDNALELMQQKHYPEAETVLQAMTQAYPGLSGPYLNLGIVYLRTERTDEAAQAVRKALDINPSNAQAYNLLGLIHREAGSFAEARQDYEQALKLAPLFADVHLNFAILLDLYLGQPQPALEHYERYQQLAGTEDKEVARWIADLKQRLPASAPAAAGGGS